jgi:hypothetical protein
MPQKHEYFTYKFEELSEEAQANALENVALKMTGDWWDSADTEDIEDLIVYTLAATFKTPGWDTYGVSDFPGIPNVTVQAWDCDRAQSLELRGTLDKTNAPALPWVGDLTSVELRNPDMWRHVQAIVNDDEEAESSEADARTLEEAVKDAMNEAIAAGTKEIEYKGSQEYAKDWVEGNEPDFYKNGELA